MPSLCSMSLAKKRRMVKSSPIVFVTGVPEANTIDLPGRWRSSTRVLTYISSARLDPFGSIPLIFWLVEKSSLRKAWASST